MAGIRLHTFWSILRNCVLEAIQTRTVSNFGAFFYIFIVNVGLYKEPEFARTKFHQKLKQKHAFYLEKTKIVQSVCTIFIHSFIHSYYVYIATIFEPQHDKTNKMTCASSEDSDQPAQLYSLIRIFAVRSVGS